MYIADLADIIHSFTCILGYFERCFYDHVRLINNYCCQCLCHTAAYVQLRYVRCFAGVALIGV